MKYRNFLVFCLFVLSIQEKLEQQKGKTIKAAVAAEATVQQQEKTIDEQKNKKKWLCEQDYHDSAPALRLIQVDPQPNPLQNAKNPLYPRIFCFVNTISIYHQSRAQAVVNTWGQRCDKLVFFSNASDILKPQHLMDDNGVFLNASSYYSSHQEKMKYEVIQLDVIADHNHLWQKHKASLQYVYDHYRHDFDWFYKADDDAYVIVENLRQYLKTPEIINNYLMEPMQMGHRFNLTQKLVSYYIVDDQLERKWRSRFHRWIFNSGGPGYIMNRLYLDKIIDILPDWTCLSDDFSEMLPDDASISFCMMWYDIYPWDTRDTLGRDRWHADQPRGVYYTNPDDPEYWYVQYHHMIGGVKWKDECCAPDSIAFHYIDHVNMYHLERQLYFCRTQNPEETLDAFNQRLDLSISNQITKYIPYVKKKKNIE
jgi:glycoprotein-N-acetylgalactosamine 3-beta-galactosyltransferase